MASLYAFGSNGSGQLGIGHKDDVSTPRQCYLRQNRTLKRDTGLEDAKAIVAGGNHTLILNKHGRVLASGDTSDGRTGPSAEGVGSYAERNGGPRFFPVTFMRADGRLAKKFDFISSTWEASTFVTADGTEIYTCGAGTKGELGHGEDMPIFEHPLLIRSFPPLGLQVVDVASCMSHNVVVLSSGEVWGWGVGRKGQLGEPSETVWRPRRIEGIPFRAVKAACGREFTIVAAEPDDGSFLVLGSDKWEVKSSAPSDIRDWKQIETTWSGIYVLYKNGNLVSWGRNDLGQRGPKHFVPMEQISAGSEHVLGRTTHGGVWAWGWGEHGNCGGVMINGKAIIVDDEEAEFVGAGCATSFVVMY